MAFIKQVPVTELFTGVSSQGTNEQALQTFSCEWLCRAVKNRAHTEANMKDLGRCFDCFTGLRNTHLFVFSFVFVTIV